MTIKENIESLYKELSECDRAILDIQDLKRKLRSAIKEFKRQEALQEAEKRVAARKETGVKIKLLED